MLAVHVKDGGKAEVKLPRKAKKVVDLLTGRTVAEDADRITDEFASPDTKIYEAVY
jgi:hypothetical protein